MLKPSLPARIALALLLAFSLVLASGYYRPAAHAQTSSVKTITDITGTAATVAVCSTCGTVKWLQLVAPSTNASNARWGDSNTAVNRGALIAPSGGMYMAYQQICPCDLGSIYLYIANGDVITVSFGY